MIMLKLAIETLTIWGAFIVLAYGFAFILPN